MEKRGPVVQEEEAGSVVVGAAEGVQEQNPCHELIPKMRAILWEEGDAPGANRSQPQDVGHQLKVNSV